MKVNDIDGEAPVKGEREERKEDKFYKFAAGRGGMNLPNKLTLSRVLMIPVFVVLFYV